MKIEELNLSVRAYNCLRRNGITTVEQLSEMSDDDLMAIRCFGIGCLKEVHRKLGKEESIRPVIPGPDADDPNIMELCFHNGEAHMKEKIIAMLMEHKTKVNGVCHAHVVEIIRMVEGM